MRLLYVLAALPLAAALPPPPYAFPVARVLYQPQWVRAEAARKVTPDGVALISAFGWTLGGVFIVDWTDSPIGPYTEAAVLSGLVWRGGTLGAWASHLVVTSPDAVAAGRELWGLPVVEGTVLLTAGPEPQADQRAPPGLAAGTSADLSEPIVFDFESGSRVVVSGWDTDWRDVGAEHAVPGPSISLPSLSGGLPPARLIYRYPLTLRAPRRVRLRPAARTTWTRGICNGALADVLDGPAASPCLQLDGVDIEAGAALVLQSRGELRWPWAADAEEGADGAVALVEHEAGGVGGAVSPTPAVQLSAFLLVLDFGVLILYGLSFALLGLFTSGEALGPPAAPMQVVVE